MIYKTLEKVEESECWKMLEQFLSLDIRDELWPFSHVWDSSGGHRDIFNIGTMLNLTPATTKLVKMLKMSSSIINYHLIPPAPARHRAHSWEHRLNFEIVNIFNISTLILWYSVDRSQVMRRDEAEQGRSSAQFYIYTLDINCLHRFDNVHCLCLFDLFWGH